MPGVVPETACAVLYIFVAVLRGGGRVVGGRGALPSLRQANPRPPRLRPFCRRSTRTRGRGKRDGVLSSRSRVDPLYAPARKEAIYLRLPEVSRWSPLAMTWTRAGPGARGCPRAPAGTQQSLPAPPRGHSRLS